MERHTHYICLAFLRCVLQMCPQMAWPGGCKFTQVAFVQFFIFALVAFFSNAIHCAISKVSSNFLPERRHIRIFWLFSNVYFKWILKSPAIIDLGAFIWRFFTMYFQIISINALSRKQFESILRCAASSSSTSWRCAPHWAYWSRRPWRCCGWPHSSARGRIGPGTSVRCWWILTGSRDKWGLNQVSLLVLVQELALRADNSALSSVWSI